MASYCVACGGQLSVDANFCSSCGKPVSRPDAQAFSSGTPLVRPRVGRSIAGVCRGFSNHFGWDVTYTRIIFALLAVLTFPVLLLAYVVCWVVMPQEPMAIGNDLRTIP